MTHNAWAWLERGTFKTGFKNNYVDVELDISMYLKWSAQKSEM